MKNDDIELLQGGSEDAEMGMHALEVINPKVYDDSMALMLARESFKYGELHDRARAVLLSKNQTPGSSQQGKAADADCVHSGEHAVEFHYEPYGGNADPRQQHGDDQSLESDEPE